MSFIGFVAQTVSLRIRASRQLMLAGLQFLNTHYHLDEADQERQPRQQQQYNKVVEERSMLDVIAARQREWISSKVLVIANPDRSRITEPHDCEGNRHDHQIKYA